MADVWIDDAGPRLLAALPCEDGAASAALDDGRASLQRIFYDLYATAFPAAFDRLNLATIWMGGEGEYTVGARLSGPSGEIVAEVGMVYQSRPEPATAVLLIHFGGPLSPDGRPTVLALPEPGQDTVDVLLEGVPVFHFPLFVIGPTLEADDGTN